MNISEKKRFAKGILAGMENTLMDNIDNGNIPENWEGAEIRWYITYLAKNNCYDADPIRRKEFEFDLLQNGNL